MRHLIAASTLLLCTFATYIIDGRVITCMTCAGLTTCQ